MYDSEDVPQPIMLSFILSLCSVLYGFVITVRNFLYDKNKLKSSIMPCRVICIGNVSVGGTGKTPVTVMTAKMLLKEGYSLAVVSRGYGGSSKEPLVASDGESILADARLAGDEPIIIANALKGVPVVVGRDRVKAAELAVARFKPQIILLDDGFQHRKLERNVNVITVDAKNPWGNEKLLPRGILREHPFALKRAQAVMVTRFDDTVNKARTERMIRYYDRRIPIYYSAHVPRCLRMPGKDETIGLEKLQKKPVAVLSNIADPSSFHTMVTNLDAAIVQRFVMKDHHRYTPDEIETICQSSKDAGAEILVMTAKDERNLPDGFSVDTIECYVLDISAEMIADQEKYLELIKPSGLNRS